MKDLKSIVSEYHNIDFTQRKAVLATVVKVRGSSYRSPGARMLITDDGKWVGSISGGCLEGDALRKSRQVMTSNIPMTITYDTREESNQNIGIGLGCNGVIDILLEPIDFSNERNIIRLFESFLNTTEQIAIASIFKGLNSCIGEKLILSADGKIHQSFSNEYLSNKVTEDLAETFISKRSEAKTYTIDNSEIEIFLEVVQPVISVIIFGGGFDARPVSQLAKSLGWNVTVTDECVAHIAPLFFPTADKLSLCKREMIDEDFTITPYTACVLMSHNYEYDRDVLKKLLTSPAPYIGILGPVKRFNKMVDEFKQQGIHLTAAITQRIHSPIGLDIGAEAPDEIAISIIAEIQTKFANRSGGFLKYRTGPIHQRDHASDQVFKQVYLKDINPSKSDGSYG